jgi:chemotaxis protein CheZ
MSAQGNRAMDSNGSLRGKYGQSFDALALAFADGREAEFEHQLDELLRVRERGLFIEIGKLSRDLSSALERFTFDARIVDLAEKDVPDARHRLEHVLKMTDEAAHKTMDLVEGACPLAERAGRAAAEVEPLWREFRERRIDPKEFRGMLERIDQLLPSVRHDAESIRHNLNEVLLAQGYQDLTGQIIRSVMQLVGEVEDALGDLVRLSASDTELRREHSRDGRAPTTATLNSGMGPVVPGIQSGPVVSDQEDVDALLSGLGM